MNLEHHPISNKEYTINVRHRMFNSQTSQYQGGAPSKLCSTLGVTLRDYLCNRATYFVTKKTIYVMQCCLPSQSPPPQPKGVKHSLKRSTGNEAMIWICISGWGVVCVLDNNHEMLWPVLRSLELYLCAMGNAENNAIAEYFLVRALTSMPTPSRCQRGSSDGVSSKVGRHCRPPDSGIVRSVKWRPCIIILALPTPRDKGGDFRIVRRRT